MRQVIAYRFGTCEVNLQRRALFVRGRQKSIGNKVFAVLCALIEHRHRVVSREELARLAWPSGSVSEAAVSRAMTRCREAIEDHGDVRPRIRAFWGQGYRFADEVEEILEEVRLQPLSVAVVPPAVQRRRLAAIPTVHAHSGHVDALTLAVDQEVALCLGQEGTLQLCSPDQVTPLLGDLPSHDHLAKLHRLWCHLGSITVLAIELTGTRPNWSGRAILFGPDGSSQRGPEAFGPDAASLARTLAHAVSETLATRGHPDAPLDLPDSFTAEAYLRANHAADEWHWHRARHLALVVCDQAPESLSAQTLLLRTLLHTHTPSAVDIGERLLTHIGQRVAPEYLASIHVALGQSLSLFSDPASHERARVHLQSAVALAKGKPAAVWGVRAHLAFAANEMLGNIRSRENACVLLEEAAAMAESCGNRFLASAARSNLGYLLHHDGHIERSLRLHEPALQEVQARRLAGPSAFALGMKAELIRAWGQLAQAQELLDQAWTSLERVAREDRAQPAAYLAYVQTALSLDRGCGIGMRQALLLAPRLEDCQPRHRVHLAIAFARGALLRGRWCESREWLDRAVAEAQTHGLTQMMCPPTVMWVQLAMAMSDRTAVEGGLDRLEALDESQQRVATRAEVCRARAWLALRDGDLHGAARALAPVTLCAHESYYVYMGRLDAVWIALRLGSVEQAASLFRVCAHWADRSPLGRITAMAIYTAQGRSGAARECLHQARQMWHRPWPLQWKSPDAVVAELGDRPPSHALLRLLADSGVNLPSPPEGATPVTTADADSARQRAA